MFDLRLGAAMVDAAYWQRRPGLMLLMLEEMQVSLDALRASIRARELPQVLPGDGLMATMEVALLAGVDPRTVQRAGLPIAATRPSRRGGRHAHLYAVDDVIRWLLARSSR